MIVGAGIAYANNRKHKFADVLISDQLDKKTLSCTRRKAMKSQIVALVAPSPTKNKLKACSYLLDCIRINLRGSKIFLGGAYPKISIDNTLYSFPPNLRILDRTLIPVWKWVMNYHCYVTAQKGVWCM